MRLNQPLGESAAGGRLTGSFIPESPLDESINAYSKNWVE
jgi:hypothetical protein